MWKGPVRVTKKAGRKKDKVKKATDQRIPTDLRKSNRKESVLPSPTILKTKGFSITNAKVCNTDFCKSNGIISRLKQGSVLIGVLWALFFLTALALVINVSITPQLTLAASLRDRLSLRYLAEAGVQRSILKLRSDETEEYDALNESWAHHEEVFKDIFLTDGGYFSVEYEINAEDEEEGGKRYGLTDEERKINVNTAPVDVLTRVFEIVGEVSHQEATVIAESMVDWRDEDDDPMENGAEDNYYEGLEAPYTCKNANFNILDELLLVRGITQELFDHVKSYLTVYGAGMVNINTTDASILPLLGVGVTLAERIIVYRDGNDGEGATEDDHIFESAQSFVSDLSDNISMSPEEMTELTNIVNAGLIGVRSDYFRGESYGRFQDKESAFKVIFVISRDETIQYWKEM
jgi:general secretion pathway protein K